MEKKYKEMINEISEKYLANPCYETIVKLADEYETNVRQVYTYLYQTGAKKKGKFVPRNKQNKT